MVTEDLEAKCAGDEQASGTSTSVPASSTSSSLPAHISSSSPHASIPTHGSDKPSWQIPTLSTIVPAGWGPTIQPAESDPEYTSPTVDWSAPRPWDPQVEVDAKRLDIDVEGILRDARDNSTAGEAQGGWDAPVRGIHVIGPGLGEAGGGWGPGTGWTKDGKGREHATSQAPPPASTAPTPASTTAHTAPATTAPATGSWDAPLAPTTVLDIQKMVNIRHDPQALVGSLSWDPEEHEQAEDVDEDNEVY